jgi:hypothetical protein
MDITTRLWVVTHKLQSPATKNVELHYHIHLQHAGESPPVPIRGLSKRSDKDEEEEGEREDFEQPVDEKLNIHDLMPHVDISSHITDSLLSELQDRDWKVCIFLSVFFLLALSFSLIDVL